MSNTYHVSIALKEAGTATVHPRAADVYAARINAWAQRYTVSAASAAGTALNIGLIDNGIAADVDAVHPESLGVICGVLLEVETAVTVTCAALARPRPSQGHALMTWQAQQKSAALTRQEVSAAFDTLQRWQQVRVDEIIESMVASIPERSVGAEERGELKIASLSKGRPEIHPRLSGTRARRLYDWATLHSVSATSAASAFLNHGLQHGDSVGIAFHVTASETLSIALGELQALATALRTNVAALSRARPRGGDARRLWADQTEAANAALSRVAPAVSNLLKLLRLSKAGAVGFVVKRIANRTEPSAPNKPSKGGAS